MKKLVLLMAALVFGALGTNAATMERTVNVNTFNFGNSFIFTEGGITFAVYPDGEFDFYMDNRVNVGVGARIGNVGVTFNSGWNYNPFVQYDDYGAVVQVENVPVFYDFYGRVSQIGGVDIWYRNGRLRRVGGLNVFWNGGVFSHTTGFINVYNRHYVYRPFHRWFARPAVGFCNVWSTPYRRFYTPIRYSWHRPYHDNFRRSYARVGHKYRYNEHRRANIYRNDDRVARWNGRSESRRDVGRSNTDYANRRTSSATESRMGRNKTNRVATHKDTRVNRSGGRSEINNSNNRTSTHVNRTNRGSSITQRTTSSPRSTTVTQREVTRTPAGRTVTQRSSTYNKPNNRAVVNNRSRSNTSSVKNSSSTVRKTVSRSTTSRGNTERTATRGRSSRN